MPIPVPFAHADQGELGPQHPQVLIGRRVGAAVMSNLEYLDVADEALRRHAIEHGGLSVTGQQNVGRARRGE